MRNGRAFHAELLSPIPRRMTNSPNLAKGPSDAAARVASKSALLKYRRERTAARVPFSRDRVFFCALLLAPLSLECSRNSGG